MSKKIKKGTTLNNSMTDLVTSLTGFNPSRLNDPTALYNNVQYAPLTLQRLILSYLYMTYGILQTAIDQPVLDALRGGMELSSGELSEDDIKTLEDAMERGNVWGTVAQVGIWMRLYGGAGIVANVNQEPGQPFDFNCIEDLELYAADRWELNAPNRIAETYNFYGVTVHNSRVITLCGKEAPSVIRPQLAGWGMSEVDHMLRDLNAYFKNKNLIYELLDEAKIDVYGIEGFKNALMTSGGTQTIQKRIELANKLKNFNNAIVMDKEDTYEQKQLSFGGLSEMSKENMIGIASALRMPITKIFGISATGFNSGEDDIENYNAMVESSVRTPLRTVIRKVVELYCFKLFGINPDIDMQFKPLRILSATDEETIKTSKQNRYMQLYSSQIIDSQELGSLLKKDNLVPIETKAEKGLLDEHPQMPGMEGDGSGEGEDEDEEKGGDDAI